MEKWLAKLISGYQVLRKKSGPVVEIHAKYYKRSFVSYFVGYNTLDLFHRRGRLFTYAAAYRYLTASLSLNCVCERLITFALPSFRCKRKRTTVTYDTD